MTAKIKSKFSKNALTVLERRYLRKDEKGTLLETPDEMLWRVAKAIAKADAIYESDADLKEREMEFYSLMASLDFLPNSPTLMNAGTDVGQLSACFVLPIDDSMDAIFTALKNTALIHKTGGGTGFSFSRLRPKNDIVRSTKGVSSGPISFMQVFDGATEAVKQGGKRRGANMGILRIDHPDIMDFINAKKDLTKLTNFNISVALTEEFMQAVAEEKDYNLYNPRNGEIVTKLNAKAVFDAIVRNAWATGEPGIIFLDRINDKNPTPMVGEIESTNPCGEQPLLPYESCNLGSINLANMVKNGKIDYEKLRTVVRSSVHFLDNVIDVNRFPLKEIEELTRGNRKIGLGVMGWADLLLKLKIKYESNEAYELAEEIMKFIDDEGKKYSMELAEKRGVFPNWEKSIYKDMGIKMRNATITTIAPTGTISLLAGTSSGIEPLFAIAFTRNVMDNDKLVEVNPIFEKELKKRGLWSKELIEKVAEKGSIKNIDEIPADMREYFMVSHDILPEGHIRMQAAFQKYVDNAVSKTINFPNDATEEQVREAYLLAYQLKVKGLTIYRDGSRDEQVLTVGKKDEKEEKKSVTEGAKIKPRPRPEVIAGTTEKVSTGCGNLYVTINEDENGPFEVFARLGKTGGCAASQTEAISRLISLALRSGVNPKDVIAQLKGIRCSSPIWQKGELIMSCPDAIGKAIDNYLKRDKKVEILAHKQEEKSKSSTPKKNKSEKKSVSAVCPECGSEMSYVEGCMMCHNCGYSKCG